MSKERHVFDASDAKQTGFFTQKLTDYLLGCYLKKSSPLSSKMHSD